MAGFAAWIAANRWRRVFFVAGLFPLPLVGILSAAIVALVADLRGPREALYDVVLALGMLVAIGLLTGASGAGLAIIAGGTWAVALVMGALSGAYRSLSLPLQAGLLLALGGLLIFSLVTGDTTRFWFELPLLEELSQQLVDQGLGADAQLVREQLAQLMTGGMAASVTGSAVIALLIGSFWASAVRGEDFARVFRGIRLGYVLGGLGAVAGLAAMAGLQPFAGNALLIIATGFVFQGLAVAWWWASAAGWPGAWWLGLLLPALLWFPLLAAVELLMLAAIGFTDNWYNLRRRRSDVV